LKAVHFGAGNIGRGFIGYLLNQAGFEVTFLDVNQAVVDLLNNQTSYKVIETGSGAVTHTVTNFQALNSQTQFDEAADAVASAEILTTSVGVTVLKFLAPLLEAGLARRTSEKPLVVMACENAIGASDVLRQELAAINPELVKKALFANTAVDRIVPPQKSTDTLDVVVESFSEWVVDSADLGEFKPEIPGAIFVSDLNPFIERKLFTVNTGHASLAYLGQLAGHDTIVAAASDENVLAKVKAVLQETTQVLITRHGLDSVAQQEYVKKTIARFLNKEIDDPVVRVGRQPRRKLSRNDRLIGPAAYLAESGTTPSALLDVVEAALLFVDESDPDVLALRQQLLDSASSDFVLEVMGIAAGHPLAKELTRHVQNVKDKLRS
jgi:mannitol-1-phosphate 5-dehydrogenase